MEIDSLDRSVLAILHGDARAPWSKVARELDSSTSTVRRRYESLLGHGLIRVIGRTDVSRLGYGPPAMVKYSGPDALRPEFMERLQRHPHVRYLAATLGSAHCLVELVPQSLSALRGILSDLAEDFRVTSESFVVTHTYTSGQDWLPDIAQREVDISPQGTEVKLSADERNILGMLLRDGRISFASLAAATEKSESTVKRIVEKLLKQEIVSLRVLVEPQLLDFQSMFWAFIEVEPSRLPDAAKILSANQATKTLFATAGSCNLIGQFVLPRHADTYIFMTEVLGELPGARSAETLLESATHKRVWNIVEGNTYGAVAGPTWLFGDAIQGA